MAMWLCIFAVVMLLVLYAIVSAFLDALASGDEE